MAVLANWRSHTEPVGAFAMRLTLSATGNWQEFDLRSFEVGDRSDLDDILNAEMIGETWFQEHAILRTVEFQNTSAAIDLLVSDRASAAVGGAGDPDPADSYNTVMRNGGVGALSFATREEQAKFQYRGDGGAAIVNVEIRFDIPRLANSVVT